MRSLYGLFAWAVCSLLILTAFCGRTLFADIVVSEIMYHPDHGPAEAEATSREWIELLNLGLEPVSLTGWQFTDGVRYAFPEYLLDPGEYLVVAADPEVFAREHPGMEHVVGGWDGRLRNSGERVELCDAAGTVVDSIRYADEGEWTVRELGPVHYRHRGWIWRDDHDGGGKSLELVNPRLPNEYGSNWRASRLVGGTPGALNSVRAHRTAPLIVDVEHAPLIPRPPEPVIVRARVIGVQEERPTVRLWFRVDDSTFNDKEAHPTHEPKDYTVVEMSDEGTRGDYAAGDGLYTALIPPQEDGAVVEFFVEAIGEGGEARTWPAPSVVDGSAEQVTNALYRVDAEFDLYSYWTADAEPLRYIIMTEAERGRLARIGEHSHEAFSRARMNATFLSIDADGVYVRYNVGVRNRGKGSRRPPPNNYRIDFPNDRPWKGVTAVNINSKHTYLQFLGHKLFAMAGLPALDVARIQVRVNGSNLALDDPRRMYGSYVQVEVYGSDWARRHLPSHADGNVYRCAGKGWRCDLQYLGEEPNAYARAGYDKSTNASENDWSDLIELTWVLNESSDDTYVDLVEEVVDVDQWLRWIALQTLLVNKETNLSNGRGDDYYLYRGVEDRRFILLPYDLDNILNWPDPNTSIWLDGRVEEFPSVGRLLTHSRFVPRYYRQLRDLCESILAPTNFDPLVDQLVGDWIPPERIQEIKAFMQARRHYVLSVIPVE